MIIITAGGVFVASKRVWEVALTVRVAIILLAAAERRFTSQLLTRHIRPATMPRRSWWFVNQIRG